MKEFICRLCPRDCGVLRGETGRGWCGMGAQPRIARAAPHYDEEPVISGERGSGAVFFSGCSLIYPTMATVKLCPLTACGRSTSN